MPAHSRSAAVPSPLPVTASLPPKLEADAISAAQDAFIGAALVGPTVSVALTLAALAAATAYGAPLTLALTAVPVLVIANAYRRLNLWSANCGASFEWVGRAINPYLGFLTGWLMVAGTLIGTLSPVVALGPNVLAVFGAPTGDKWDNVLLGTMLTVVMLVISVIGIRLSARTQVSIGIIEYALLITIAVTGLWWVLTRHPGSFPVTRGWFSLTGIGGKGSLPAGFLLAVFMYSGWDGTLYVNEEVRHRRENPGKAAMTAVIIAAGLFVLAQVGLQGVVSPAKLQANSASALVYVATVIGGPALGKSAAIALALSVIAATGAGILLTARIVYGMASQRVLPPFLGNVSTRFRTPVAATVASGVILVVLTWLYLLGTSISGRVHLRHRHHRPAVCQLLHPDRAGGGGLLPAPGDERRDRVRHPGRPAARRGRVPRLGHLPDVPGVERGAEPHAAGGGRGRGGADDRSAGLPAARVLQHPAAE